MVEAQQHQDWFWSLMVTSFYFFLHIMNLPPHRWLALFPLPSLFHSLSPSPNIYTSGLVELFVTRLLIPLPANRASPARYDDAAKGSGYVIDRRIGSAKKRKHERMRPYMSLDFTLREYETC